MVSFKHFDWWGKKVFLFECHVLRRCLRHVRELLNDIKLVRTAKILILQISKVRKVLGVKYISWIQLAYLVLLKQFNNLCLLVEGVHLPEWLNRPTLCHHQFVRTTWVTLSKLS